MSERTAYLFLGFFLLCCLAIVAVGVYGYVDAETGKPGTAHITYCETTHVNARQNSVDCKGRWGVKGRQVIGWVDNADYNDLGHDISVRIHGGRATEVHLWIPIMLFVFGAVMTGFAVWAVVKIPSRLASAPGTA